MGHWRLQEAADAGQMPTLHRHVKRGPAVAFGLIHLGVETQAEAGRHNDATSC